MHWLKAEVSALQQQIDAQNSQKEHPDRFIQMIQHDDEPDHPTPCAARKLIRAVRVGKTKKIDGMRHQEIRTEYDLAGFIPVCELMQAAEAT